MISMASKVVVSKDQVSCDLAGEAAILGLKNGVYYGLDIVGARIWNLIQAPVTVAAIRNVIMEEFDVAPDRCEHDLLYLLQKLCAEGLIQIENDAAA